MAYKAKLMSCHGARGLFGIGGYALTYMNELLAKVRENATV